ncbi:ice-binding family protein [Nonomuraea sp. 3-1Str]|uniref:ice-binding family protein n=1 Tax=Nonomuraea sp. 3-1Str TaxID=2929801 RepID=UPI0028612C6B|nr:ice-binding family protein [Nonomuraea sp. 3-1Str]MDR8415147.1 ice-binding family protein [Nonomuraea sp. 3-1Str]
MSAALTGLLAMGLLTASTRTADARQSPVELGEAEDCALMAGLAVNSTDLTRIAGDIGVSPGTIVTGFPPGEVLGDIHTGGGYAARAHADAVSAYQEARGRAANSSIPSQLGGRTLGPGVYASRSGAFQIDGTLKLDAEGDPDAVFIFRADTTLDTARVSNIDVVNGAQEKNVFWAVAGTVGLGTLSTFRGNILARNGIVVNEGVAMVGRAISLDTSVALTGTDVEPTTHITLPVRPPTSTTLTSSPNPSRLNEPVTFTAVVEGTFDGVHAGGKVVFRDGTTELGSAQLNGMGIATFTTDELTRGVHLIQAVYLDGGSAVHEGWVYFEPSESPVVQHQVLNRR